MSEPRPDSRPLRRYRVLAGNHSEKGPDGLPRVYRRGEVVETRNDLLKHNHGANSQKFELIEDRYSERESLRHAREGNEPDEQYKIREPALVPAGSQTSGNVVQAQAGKDDKTRATDSAKGAGKTPAKTRSSDKEYLAQLDVMTEKELRKHAEEEEVDVSKARNRAEVLAALKAGLA